MKKKISDKPSSTTTNTMSRHIIVAEDEPKLTCSLRFILSAAGYEVTLVPNGREAFAAINNLRFSHTPADLLITDIAMPEMNGEELITALRREFIKLPVLVMTGYGDKDLVVRLMRLGCQDFIYKPFEPAQLESKIAGILERSAEQQSHDRSTEHFARLGEQSRSIIHDLNNIIGGTLGYADLALNDVDESHPACRNLRKLFSTANQAAELCRQFLSVKPDAPIFLKTNTEVRSIVEKISVLIKALAPDSVIVRAVTPEFPVWLKADPDRLQQALLNLGVNAIDALRATGPGTISMEVTMEEAFTDKNHSQRCICIAVTDTGCGIPEEKIDRLFTAEFTTKPTGHGIGLPTVKRIMDEHGGSVKVKSEPGKGSRFTLVFPI